MKNDFTCTFQICKCTLEGQYFTFMEKRQLNILNIPTYRYLSFRIERIMIDFNNFFKLHRS